jgi:uncharacterized protein with HEPN domain
MFSYTDRLLFILESIWLIEERMTTIQKEEDFISSTNGLTLLDAITMRLQSIGENLSKINKDSPLVIGELQLDITPIIGFRNIISHHYEKLDYQIIYRICTIHLHPLKEKIEAHLRNLKKDS